MISKDREYRAFVVEPEDTVDTDTPTYIVEGYAAVFEQRTKIFELDGVEYFEKIARDAFNGCDMSDVVMNFNHMGKPVARTKNGTLMLNVDDHGLKVRANLSGTEESRRLFEEIKGQYIDKMSFSFVVEKDAYERGTHERTILKFKRLFDVAAVTFPAYDATDIAARAYFTAEAEKEAAEAKRATAAEAARHRIIIST